MKERTAIKIEERNNCFTFGHTLLPLKDNDPKDEAKSKKALKDFLTRFVDKINDWTVEMDWFGVVNIPPHGEVSINKLVGMFGESRTEVMMSTAEKGLRVEIRIKGKHPW